ncbi:MAG: KH domain-containing protein [Candidatus Hodarchaeales archaeon]|jgi:exosome complex component RRP4
MTILIERNQLVIPGELLARGTGYKTGGGVFRRKLNNETEIFASMIGLAKIRENRVGVVPLEGCYIPLEGDIIIGKITRVGITSWNVDIRGPYVGTLRVGNVIDRDFDSLRESLHGRGLHKINNGRLIDVDPVKIPRIIGKKGSMIQLLKNMTGSQIDVGQNGRIVILANKIEIENLVERSIRKIEAEAHTSGLTDRIREYIEKEKRVII